MKKIIVIILSTFALHSCINIKSQDQGSCIRCSDFNSGLAEDFSKNPMASKEFEVENFSEIKAETAMKFFIKKSNKQSVVINSNALNTILVSSKNGKLNIKYDQNKGALRNVNTEVTVYTDNFSKLTVSSAGKIVISDDFQLNKLTLDLSSAGQISGNIFADYLEIEATSASNLETYIRTKNIAIEANSASKIELNGETENIDIEATSVAKIDIKKLKYKNLNQEINSFAKIYKQ